MGGRYVPSLLAAIGEVLERHMVETGFMERRIQPLSGSHSGLAAIHAIPPEGARARFCPRCGDASFVALEGCDSCLSCGYSKCS
jgi:ribonucleoside-diphosphate reductase alpha chain